MTNWVTRLTGASQRSTIGNKWRKKATSISRFLFNICVSPTWRVHFFHCATLITFHFNHPNTINACERNKLYERSHFCVLTKSTTVWAAECNSFSASEVAAVITGSDPHPNDGVAWAATLIPSDRFRTDAEMHLYPRRRYCSDVSYVPRPTVLPCLIPVVCFFGIRKREKKKETLGRWVIAALGARCSVFILIRLV